MSRTSEQAKCKSSWFKTFGQSGAGRLQRQPSKGIAGGLQIVVHVWVVQAQSFLMTVWALHIAEHVTRCCRHAAS